MNIGPGPNDFPVTDGAAQRIPPGGGDAFLVKLNPTGSALLYSTYLGGSGRDDGTDIAVGDNGEAVLVGGTNSSSDFPVTAGAFKTETDGEDGFLARIDTSGDTEGLASLLYATFLGGGTLGGLSDSAESVVLDDAGNAWVFGNTWLPDFPTTDDAYQSEPAGSRDLFLMAFDPAGDVSYSTYFGGSDFDTAGGLALDDEGFAYLTGGTTSYDFPVTPGAFKTVKLDESDAFVAKLDTGVAGAGALVYSTFLGGSVAAGGKPGGDSANAIVVDHNGNAYVTGGTSSVDFPLQNNFERCGNIGSGDIGLGDVFATVLDPTGSSLVFSTTLGTGPGRRESGNAIALDAAANLYLTGSVDGDRYRFLFPTTDGAFQEVPATGIFGRPLAFVTKIDVWDPAPVKSNCTGIYAGLYALGNKFGSGGAPMELYLLDKTNALPTYVVTTGTRGLRGLAIDESTRKFYSAYGSPMVTAKRGIVEIDPGTGAVTDIGGTKALVALAFDPSGQLYGAENSGAGLGNVYKIDTNTGAEVLLSTVTMQADAFAPGLAFDSVDNMLHFKGELGEISTIDTTSGTEMLIGTANQPWIWSHSFDFDENGNVYYVENPCCGSGLAFAGTGDIFNSTNLGFSGVHVWGLSNLSVGDADGDGVNDNADLCDATVIPEDAPTTGALNQNHWALTDDDRVFDTVLNVNGKGPNRSYTTEDTAGCSCEQIIEMQGLDDGHTKHGCSVGAMDNWVDAVNMP
ncbi:protein of unknown function [uncultured Woeseiaceae bacterium]|uniref:Uncharacterized protein n=1 Tax=uncultured Woeseiaceae bacterium TaxID=1983305 RepID=A0A7D9D440_9GAMM|nr:protein of unknown function [uncultured Woeseiaceae bacterium]